MGDIECFYRSQPGQTGKQTLQKRWKSGAAGARIRLPEPPWHRGRRPLVAECEHYERFSDRIESATVLWACATASTAIICQDNAISPLNSGNSPSNHLWRPQGQLPPVLGLAQPKRWRPNRLTASPSPSRLKARPVDPPRSPDPTARTWARPSRKPEPSEATAHLPRKPCPSRSSSPAQEASGLPWSSLETPLGPMQALRSSAQRSWSPEPSMMPHPAWEATALHLKKPCPSSLSSLHREVAASLSCRSQTSLQEAQVQGSLALLPRSPEPLKPLKQPQASEETVVLPLRRLCHLSLMEQPLGTTAHPPGSPELSHKSTAAASASPRQSRSRVRSSSLPPRTSPPSGSPAPSAAHPERLSDLLHASRATAPRWRSPDPRSRLAAPPLGSTTLPSTWTAPQSRLTARPSRSPEPQLRESEQRERDPQLREKQPRWKEAQPPPLLQGKEKSPLPGTEPQRPGPTLLLQPPLTLQPPGQPLPPLPLRPPGQLQPPGQLLPPLPLRPPGQLLPPGQPLPPLRLEPDPSSASSDPPAPRSRLPIRLLRSLLAHLPGGAGLAAAATTTRGRSAATTTTAAMNPTMGPPDAAAGCSPGEIAAAESPGATCSASSSCRPSGAASADPRAPSPKPPPAPRSRRFPWRRSADRCARKPWRSAPRSAQRRNAASSSTNNSRKKRWGTCVRTACCF
ncbi:protein ALEX-like [Panthera tigris]|uniref:protein ALEX-like n=1 Tax=Panthera tigris TaxID=9694 RepID=UPI001C6FB8FE|nr:protein ALEX-like [Panthera tigris]